MNKIIYNVSKCIPDKLYLQLMYRRHFHKFMDLKNPKTFNEKINWLKLHNRRAEYTQMVDKYAVREYIAQKLGEEYLIPLFSVWDDPCEIDFDKLPDQFVLKWNDDSGSVVLCRDKSKLNKQEVIRSLAAKKKHNGYWYGREWPYKNVKKKIIAEQYMSDKKDESKGLTDYKFYCFNGEPRFLYVSEGLENHETARISFLNLDWTFAEYERSDFAPFDELPKKPDLFDEMIDVAKKLSAGEPFLRVDLYEINNKVYFSELTFSPCAGLMPFKNKDHDLELGAMIELPM